MPNLSPNTLRADTAPPIGTSINACYGSDVELFGKSKILTYGFHSEFLGSFEIPVRCHAPSIAGTSIRNRFDKGNTALTNPDHLKKQLLAAEYDSFRRLRGRTDVLAS